MRRAWQRPSWIVAGVVGLTVLALVLRVAHLGFQSVWFDEAFTADVVRLPLGDMLDRLARDSHPPLFFLLDAITARAVPGEAGVRLVSAIAGAATVPIVFALLDELFDASTALTGALLFALAPPHIWYAQEARMYTLFTLLATLATWRLVVALRARATAATVAPRGPWVGYAVVMIACAYTHFFTVFLVAGHAAVVLVMRRREPSKSSRIRPFAWAVLAAAIAIAPWAIYTAQYPHLYLVQWIPRTSLARIIETGGFLVSGNAWTGDSRALLDASAVIFALALIGALVRVRVRAPIVILGDDARNVTALYVLAASAAVPIALVIGASLVLPMYLDRYLLAFLIAPLAIAARGIARQRGVGGAALLLGLCACFTVISARTILIVQKGDWRVFSDTIANEGRPGDVVLIVPSHDELTFRYYARGPAEIVRSPREHDLGDAEAVANELASRHARIWYVGNFSIDRPPILTTLARRFRRIKTVPMPGHFYRGFHLDLYELDESLTATPRR